MSAGGKGHAPRPKSVDEQTYADRWDAIFKPKEQDDEPTDVEAESGT